MPNLPCASNSYYFCMIYKNLFSSVHLGSITVVKYFQKITTQPLQKNPEFSVRIQGLKPKNRSLFMPSEITQENKNYTQVKNNLEAFKNVMEGASFTNPEAVETHVLMLHGLQNLVDETDRFYEKKNGVYPSMEENSFQHFTFLYQDVLSSIQEYKNIMSRQTGPDKEVGDAMVLIMDPVEELLQKDILTLGSAHAKGELTTLPDLVDRARTQTIDITGQEYSLAGDNLSTRFKISIPEKNNEKPVTGFFTENTSSEESRECDAITQRWLQKNPNIQTILDKMDKESWYDILDNMDRIQDYHLLGCAYPKDISIHLSPDRWLKPYLSLSEKESQKLFDKTGLAQDFMEYASEYSKVYQKYRILELAGIENNNNIAQRNSAMSTVAEILGMGDLIARSESAVLTDGSKKYKGTFMESAKGTDLMHCQPGDPLLSSDTTVDMESVSLKKQLSDLQVLDYICGNIDRHVGNMLYQTHGTDSRNLRLDKIQGIDNDCSFGTITTGMQRLPNAERMGVISESTARTVSLLNKDLLKTALRNYHLSDAEIDAAWNRTRQIQEAIREGNEFYRDKAPGELTFGHLRTVKDSDWKDLSMDNLSEHLFGSYFANVSLLSQSARQAFFTKECEKSRHEYKNAFSDFYNEGKNGLHLSQMLKKEDKGLLTGSRLYSHVTKLAEQTEQLHKNALNGQISDNVRQLMDSYTGLLNAARSYLNHKESQLQERMRGKSLADQQKELKKFQDPNSRDFKRMAAVSNVISQVEKYQKQSEKLLKGLNDYIQKKELLDASDEKQSAYLKNIEEKSAGKSQKEKRPQPELISKEELFGHPKSKSFASSIPVRSADKKLPERRMSERKSGKSI